MEFNLADLFESVVDAVPDRIALVTGTERRTYRELDERANRLAHHLRDSGVRAGDHVGIHARNRVEWDEAMLAAFKIRAVPININYRYVEDELLYLFENADLVALVHEREYAPRIAAIRDQLPMLRHLLMLEDDSGVDVRGLETESYDDVLAEASPSRDFDPRSPDDHYVLYTGGTTGMPKGVIWRHEDIFFGALGGGDPRGTPIARPDELPERIAEDPAVSLAIAPMMHGGGQWVTLIGWFGGGTVVLYTGASFDAHELWRIVERERVNSVSIVGDAMGRPLAEALADPDADYDVSSVFAIGSGGAILSKAVKEQLREQLPNAIISDSFGASETGFNGTVMDFDGPAQGSRFTLNEDTTVLDDEMRPVAPGSGVVGRLARRGHVPLGYHKDPEKTARTFPTVDGERWVLPGDFAAVEEDGTIQLLGRGSVCINTGGEKVYPEEVEAAIKAHPEIFDAVVVGIPDDRFGEKVAALVKARPERTPELRTLQEHCRGRLAGYKVPRAVHVVDDILRTPAGKPDYRWARTTMAKALSG